VSNANFSSEPELKALFIKANEGHNASYNSFLLKVSGLLRGYFRKRLQSVPFEVEDLVQEVLMAIHNQRHTYNPDYPVTAWLYGIARYKVIDLYRRQNRAEHIDIDDAEDLLGFEEREAQDAQHDVSALVEQLPAKQREAIERVKLEGLSIAEAAAASGQSESLIKVNIHRGLKKLAELMKSQSS
jgi:RNA polymerase sigma-70 factor, ECF subfamily